MDAGVLRLLWPGNSPDLNMIEPCWPWMKRKITKKGPSTTRAEGEKAWSHCWLNQLKQHRIQGWIERIPRHIQEMIALEGGNEYREGKSGGLIRPYDSDERRGRYKQLYGRNASDESDVD